MELIYKTPSVDFEETSFKHSYTLATEALREEAKAVRLLVQRVTHAEEDQCKLFHDKFARSLNIPLTLQAYLYGDLQKKPPKVHKLARNNSMHSRMSRDKNGEEKEINKADFEIRER